MLPIESGIPIAAGEAEGERLANEVLDPERTQPIVCLSTRSGESEPAFDPAAVRKVVGPDVLLRGVKTGPATRYLDALLPRHFGVFGGAARIWWPGVDGDSDPRKHPLILDKQDKYGNRAVEILGQGYKAGPPPVVRKAREPKPKPKPAEDEKLAALEIPAAVVRDRTRAHHLEIFAAWLARDHDAGRRDRPLGPLAIGEGYLGALDAVADRVSPAAVAVVAARIASGKQGEADDLRVAAELEADGSPVLRKEDGAACWRCVIPDVSGLRLRWWTREDGAVELRDVV